jgi:hypothetical protein
VHPCYLRPGYLSETSFPHSEERVLQACGRVAEAFTLWQPTPLNPRVAGGPPFHTTQTNAVEFPGGASLRGAPRRIDFENRKIQYGVH